jgi:hypothetical protein
LLDNNASGTGFDELTFEVTVDGSVAVLDRFTSLGSADAFFTNNKLYLGAFDAGNQTVDLLYSLTASEVGAGFGFTYFASGVPEPSTWAMTLLGFAGLGYMGYRRARAGRDALAA